MPARNTLAAVAAFVLSLTYLAELVSAVPAELAAVRGYGLIALTLWCFFEAVAGHGKEGGAIRALEAAKADSQATLDSARAQSAKAGVMAKADAQRVVAAAKSDATAALAVAKHDAVEARDHAKNEGMAALAVAKNDAARAQAALAKLEGELRTERLKTPEREVVSLLALLQSRGRFIDFLMDDITKYADAQVGAAARVVHQGCVGVVREYFDIKPVRQDPEGSSLTLEKDFDAHSVRLLGKVLGDPPFHGRLLHRGWQTASVNLPKVQAAGGVGLIAPAEVELN